MFNNVTELFLSTYFLIDKTAGKLINNDRLLFDRLASVCLYGGDKDSLYKLTQSQDVRELHTYNDYAQICRIQKYSELNGCLRDMSSETRQIINIKGSVLRKAKQLEMDNLSESTDIEICKRITDSANRGVVVSLCALGFLQCEGIYVEQDTASGLKNLEKAAQWNNAGGILLSLYYNESNRKNNLNRLRVITEGTFNEELFDYATERYGQLKACAYPESKLLQKAFGAGVLKPDVYAPQYARLIFSQVLSLKDKERALFSGNKETVSETVDLPLKLNFDKIVFNAAEMVNSPLLRKTEAEKICKSFLNSDMRQMASYRPLCICSDSKMLAELYLDAIGKALSQTHVEKIDVANLRDYDFEPTKGNVFSRSCDEDKSNVYILQLRGEIDAIAISAVQGFLQSERRQKFRLLNPDAVIDLSAVLPVCFCDRQNAASLKPYCEMVTLAPVSANEKRVMFNYLLDEKAKQYGIGAICVSQGAIEALAKYSLDNAATVIDRIVQGNRCGGQLTITEQMVIDVTVSDVTEKSEYGFGGIGNESK